MMVEDLKWVQVAKEWYTEKGRAEGKAEGKAEGIAEGKAEGKAEAFLLSAKALMQNGFSPEKVADMLQLPPEIVKML